MKGTWDMGRSEKIDYRRFYEADFSGFDSAMSKKVLMVENNYSQPKTAIFLLRQKKANR
jgi:hypothetical protein